MQALVKIHTMNGGRRSIFHTFFNKFSDLKSPNTKQEFD